VAKRILFVLATTIAFSLTACDRGDTAKTPKAEVKPKATETEMNARTNADSLPRPLANVPADERLGYYKSAPEMVIDKSKTYVATVHTEKGDIVMEFNAFYAPLHTNNFVFLARQGFYDGLTFHRVVPNFVIQGGDPLGVGKGGPGYLIPAEIGLPHEQGAVAMARQPDQVNPEKKSSGSQFYITLKPTPFLDGEYSVFGKVTAGFDVVQNIAGGDLITHVDIEGK